LRPAGSRSSRRLGPLNSTRDRCGQRWLVDVPEAGLLGLARVVRGRAGGGVIPGGGLAGQDQRGRGQRGTYGAAGGDDLGDGEEAGAQADLVGLVSGFQVGAEQTAAVSLDVLAARYEVGEGGFQPDQPRVDGEFEQSEGALGQVAVGQANRRPWDSPAADRRRGPVVNGEEEASPPSYPSGCVGAGQARRRAAPRGFVERASQLSRTAA
jgi:hypothetical protein